jgi:hypothetical protein
MKLTRARISWALAVMVSTILATSFLVVPAVNAATADTTTPVLTSFSVSATQVTPGQQVTFSYVAADDSGSLGRLGLYFVGLSGHQNVIAFEGPLPVAGSVTFTVPDTWWNGLNYQSWVTLTDPSGNNISYSRAGYSMVSPAGATGPTSHTLDFKAGDLTVSGSTADAAVPVLTSVSVSGSPAAPGQTISAHYEATDTSGSLKAVVMTFRDAYQITRTLTAPVTGALPLSGVIDQVIPASWPNGAYVLDTIVLTDPQDNIGWYNALGRVTLKPTGVQGPSSHTVDFGAATFTVSGSTADFTPPVLTSVKLTGSPMALGGTAKLSYTAESQDPLTTIRFTYTNPGRNSYSFYATAAPLAGTVSAVMPTTASLVTYALSALSLTDSAGNSITYNRDGTTSRFPGVQAGTHTIPMSSMDLVVNRVPDTAPSAPSMGYATARSRSTLVSWNASDPHGSPITRYTVTAQPGGRTVTTNGSAEKVEMTGLTNETTYRFTVTATNAIGTGPASSPSAAVTPRMSTNLLGTGDFSGDGHADLLGVRSPPDGYRSAYLYRGNGTGGFGYASVINHYYEVQDRIILSVGLFDGYKTPNILIVDYWGYLLKERGDGHGGFPSSRMIVGRGWAGTRNVFGAGDFSGDGKPDVMSVRADGGLYLSRGDGQGNLFNGQRVGNGWGNFLTVFSPGDFSGDGKIDVLAISKDGGLYLYRGNGLGGFSSGGQRIGTGWGGFLSVFSPGDFTGDRKSDVMAVKSNGDLMLYRGNGLGGWASGGLKIGIGWDIFR